ncbi:hypothetical protein BKA70DRAFT_1270100 [Coprinopsis sp. MPI-PUGE-AT-0042]|nr:hypothetical protein BKA70DRAFT_1270100 [Coprinopsis sp. MPI-PUGE-AT-0042]
MHRASWPSVTNSSVPIGHLTFLRHSAAAASRMSNPISPMGSLFWKGCARGKGLTFYSSQSSIVNLTSLRCTGDGPNTITALTLHHQRRMILKTSTEYDQCSWSSAVTFTEMRRYARRAPRFETAYLKGLSAKQAAWACNKYRGHRVISETILAELDKAGVTLDEYSSLNTYLTC